MVRSTMTTRRYLMLAVVTVTTPLGDFFLSRGMKQIGPVSLSHFPSLFAAVWNPSVLMGICLLITYFATYLSALSWADLTYILPSTAMGNVIMALLAKFFLQEPISVSRWAGILLITAGVGFVARGPSYTAPACTFTKEPSEAPTEEALR
jgi:drug/metabolite transporter (DMT)-like permease